MPVALPGHSVQIDRAPRTDRIRAILDTDPVWSAYAIADLQPEYAPYSHWCIGEDTEVLGLTLLFTRLAPPAFFAMGDPGAVARAMECAGLPDTLYMTLQETHYAVASQTYDFSEDQRPMWRMALTDPAALCGGADLPRAYALRTLGAGDGDLIGGLFAHGGSFAPDAFDAYQTAEGTFFGVVDASGDLMAAGGTHIVDWRAGIGAIGNMYTHPAHRGRGFGSTVLRAIAGKLIGGGVTNIVLNVDERNIGAKRLYERHGFTAYCPYLEGPGRRI